MALPTVSPYGLPGPEDFPDRKVPWRIDPARAAVLVHDLQNYFLRAFPADGPPLAPALANTARILTHARRLGMPVVYSHQRGGQTPAERGLQLDFWGPGLPDDPTAQGVPDIVAPAEQDLMLLKWKYSAFARTELAAILDRTGRDQLVIVGVYAHIGVMMTAADAWSHDIQAFVVGDAVADFSPEKHREALSWAADKCAVVLGTDEFLETE